MAHCTILVPGLLGPDVPLAQLPHTDWPDTHQLPNLASLLSQSHKKFTPAWRSIEALFLYQLGFVFSADDELPIAALRANNAVQQIEPRWCLDPVYVQLDREVAYLAACEDLALTEHEARELIASLNRHFADDLHIEYHQAQQWLVSMNLHVHTHTPSEALQQDIKRMHVTGEDARRWRSLLNEMQMLLHDHPVNQQRLGQQQLPVNSLWLWGGGQLKRTPVSVDIVYSDHELSADAAARNGITHRPLPPRYTADMFDQQRVLIILTEQLSAIRNKDVYAWFESLRRLETDLLQVLFALLRQNRLQALSVCSEQLCFTLDKKALPKWWRRPRALETTLLGLRQSYPYEA